MLSLKFQVFHSYYHSLILFLIIFSIAICCSISISRLFFISTFIFHRYYWFPVLCHRKEGLGWGNELMISIWLAYKVTADMSPWVRSQGFGGYERHHKCAEYSAASKPSTAEFTAVTKAAELAGTRHRTQALLQAKRSVAERDGRFKTPPSNRNQNLLVPRPVIRNKHLRQHTQNELTLTPAVKLAKFNAFSNGPLPNQVQFWEKTQQRREADYDLGVPGELFQCHH